jgi:hypothetical protein
VFSLQVWSGYDAFASSDDELTCGCVYRIVAASGYGTLGVFAASQLLRRAAVVVGVRLVWCQRWRLVGVGRTAVQLGRFLAGTDTTYTTHTTHVLRCGLTSHDCQYDAFT